MTSRLTIDLDALANNFHVLAREAAGAEVAPVVKADGYGLGAAQVSRRLWDEGARTFFVARLEEGERLRAEMEGRDCTILVLDGLTQGSDGRLLDASLTPVFGSADQARAWKGPPGALHVDTGMNRLGVNQAEAEALAREGVRFSLVMSHLGNGEDPAHPRNAAQLTRFGAARALFPDVRASLSASSGTYLGPEYRFDAVRPGISLYGGGPREVPDDRIRAVATLEAPVLQVRDLKAGEQAGYGAMFTAPRDMTLAVVGCGYADGVLRLSHRGAYGCVNGRPAPFAIVTMDLIGLDVTASGPVGVGDMVELLGENAKLDHLARAADSVAHECLVRLGARNARIYLAESR